MTRTFMALASIVVLALVDCRTTDPQALRVVTMSADTCERTPYRVGKILEDSPSAITILVSTDIVNFVPERLVCLGRTLKMKYADRGVIAALIFSSRESAVRFTVPGI